jgi:peptide/nickel transport system permease protein
MSAFIARRVLRMAITIWVIVNAVFLATRLTGNPIDYLMPEGMDAEGRAAMIAYWGLDGSLWDQYLLFWRSLFQGEFGLGLAERRPVMEIFAERMGRSLGLLSLALLATVAIGVPLGVLAAVWRQRALGAWVLLVAFLGYAIPNFILAILLLLLFSFTLHWLPSAGASSGWHYVMPVATLAAYFIAALVRYTRTAMLDVLGQDYIRTAHAKGLSPAVVLVRHGLRNALIPVVTVLGLQVATLVSGAVVIETVFAWNGMGDLLVGATLLRDYPVLQFGVLVVACAVIVVNLLVDLAYVAIDPRVRLA